MVLGSGLVWSVEETSLSSENDQMHIILKRTNLLSEKKEEKLFSLNALRFSSLLFNAFSVQTHRLCWRKTERMICCSLPEASRKTQKLRKRCLMCFPFCSRVEGNGAWNNALIGNFEIEREFYDVLISTLWSFSFISP